MHAIVPGTRLAFRRRMRRAYLQTASFLFFTCAACAPPSDGEPTSGEDDITAPRLNPGDPKDGETIIADGKLFRYGDVLDPTSTLVVRTNAPVDITQALADTVGVDLPPEGDDLGVVGIGLRATGRVATYTDLYGRPRVRFVALDELVVCPGRGTTVDCATFAADDRHGPVCAPKNRAWLATCEGVTVR